jgi:ABC-type Na+ efflux pump permease subunit
VFVGEIEDFSGPRAEHVRGAQSLVGYIYPFLFIPSTLLMYLNVNSLPLWLRAVLFAIPYSL